MKPKEKEKPKKISEADKLFEELGYKQQEDELFADYSKRNEEYDFDMDSITFNKNDKTFDACSGYELKGITMQELKAINKKCLELGWLGE